MEELLEHKPLEVSEGDIQTLLEQQAGVQSFASKLSLNVHIDYWSIPLP